MSAARPTKSAVRDPRLARLPRGDADARAQAAAYRLSQLPTGMHPLARARAGLPRPQAADPRGRGQYGPRLALLDRMGTVPALRYGRERVQSNRVIARFLDQRAARAAAVPGRRAAPTAVEQAEPWGDEVLQMAARRIALTGSLHGLDSLRDRGNSGRLGALLSPRSRCACSTPRGARMAFKANAQAEAQLLRSCRRCSTASTRGSPRACSTASS